jgi:hypothetical protein
MKRKPAKRITRRKNPRARSAAQKRATAKLVALMRARRRGQVRKRNPKKIRRSPPPRANGFEIRAIKGNASSHVVRAQTRMMADAVKRALEKSAKPGVKFVVV